MGSTVKYALVALAVFLVAGLAVFAAGAASSPSVGLPQPIAADSACPAVGCASGSCHGYEAVGCASGSCHGYEAVPEPDGVHEMSCPETSCSSVACHAWDTLVTRYNRPSDSSLNVWIMAPVVIVVALVLVVRKL
ncbi:hypothetical protein [Eggerthella sinensis]|uniref:hypothetical protein n=1 Tax=Eggerthella sinensis TaxID=242230 RepID=UPI0022E2B472|nr:hypothetical protein [Eggerthella sinensis]